MASSARADDKGDFDVFSLFSGPASIMTNLFAMADAGRKTIGAVSETIQSLQRAATAIERLAKRLDGLVDDLETPFRALVPDFERAAERLKRLGDAFEAPVERLVPNLEQAIRSLDRVGTNQLPETLELVREQLAAVMEGFADLPKLFAPLTEMVPGFGLLAGFDRWLPKPRIAEPAAAAVPRPTQARRPATEAATKPASTKKAGGPSAAKPAPPDTTPRRQPARPKASTKR